MSRSVEVMVVKNAVVVVVATKAELTLPARGRGEERRGEQWRFARGGRAEDGCHSSGVGVCLRVKCVLARTGKKAGRGINRGANTADAPTEIDSSSRTPITWARNTAAYEERGSEQDEREVESSSRGEEAPSGAPTGKKGHRERLTMAETHLDVLEASVEELYQCRGRLLGVESSQEEAETRIENVESLIDEPTEDTKPSVSISGN
ncbi:hypothetical protein BHE74_00010099 [Ensete ventricosum]|nr:hypothetical protein BHE74_00010099 [Ensete ventricosum]